jgi:hypothetical protein
MRRPIRHGLSPLEFVLALPMLLFVMALMLNFGTVASWKVRTLGAARHAAWSTRAPRSGMQYPRPANWPPAANLGAGGAGDHAPMDDPRVDHPVARGPVLPLGTAVNSGLLDPSRGFREGSANLRREFPLLRRLGPYALAAHANLLDNPWPFWRHGLYSNHERRVPVLYALARAPASLAQAYVQAVYAILRAPFREDLRPLDRDDEFDGYQRRFRGAGGSPDFHPVLHRFCSLSRTVADQAVADLIDRIGGRVDRDDDGNVIRRVSGVPETMTRAFIRLYQWVIQQLQAQLGVTPPPPPDQRAAIQAEIDQLQGQIQILQDFLGTL